MTLGLAEGIFDICWLVDPLGQPSVMADRDHCFRTYRPSVSIFSKSSKIQQSENNDHYWRDCGSGRVDHWWLLSCNDLRCAWMKFSFLILIIFHLKIKREKLHTPLNYLASLTKCTQLSRVVMAKSQNIWNRVISNPMQIWIESFSNRIKFSSNRIKQLIWHYQVE